MKNFIFIFIFIFSINLFAGTTPTQTSIWGSVPPTAASPGASLYFISIPTGGNDLEYRFSSIFDGGQPQVIKDWGRDNFLNTTLPMVFTSVIYQVDVRGVGQSSFVSATQTFGFLQDITIADSYLSPGDTLKISHPSFHLGQTFNTNFISIDGFSAYVASSVIVEGELSVPVPKYIDPLTNIETQGEVAVFVTGITTRSRPLLLIENTNELPEPLFVINPSFAFAPAQISFDASTSFDPDGSITKFDWDFGDGTTETTTSPVVGHQYIDEGIYFVKLTVTDNSGWKNRLIQAVTVALNVPAIEQYSAGQLTLVQNLNGLFYPLETDLVFTVTGVDLNTDPGKLRLTLNGHELLNTNVNITTTQINLNSLVLNDGKNILEVSATDVDGLPLMKEFILWAGNQNLIVNLNDKSNNSVTDGEVTIKLMEDQAIVRTIPHVNGSVIIDNLPSVVSQGFVISAKSSNLLALENLEVLPETISLTLLGFKPVSTIVNDDFSQGADGWDISEATPEIVPHDGKFDTIKHFFADQDMRLSLESRNFQKVTRTIIVSGMNTGFYHFRYKFIQAGYDLYQVVLRNMTTGEVVSESRNSLELALWRTLSIEAKNGDILQSEVKLIASVKKKKRLGFSSVYVDKADSTYFGFASLFFKNASLNEMTGFSVGPRVDFGSAYGDGSSNFPQRANNTLLYGTIIFQASEGQEFRQIKGVRVEAIQLYSIAGQRIVQANLGLDASSVLINKPFSSETRALGVSDIFLFEFPDHSLDQFDSINPVYLKVIATTDIGTEVEYTNPIPLFPLKQYKYQGRTTSWRMNVNRDPLVGGDDWSRDFMTPYLDSLLNNFSGSPYGITYNDISNMNGGKPSDHNTHEYGSDIDLRINNYCVVNTSNVCVGFNDSAENAKRMVDLLNSYNHLASIESRKLFTTYPENGKFYKYLKYSCLSDHRPALDVFNRIDNHSDHFHIHFRQTPNSDRQITTTFSLPATASRTQTISLNSPQSETGGTIAVDWGDGSTIDEHSLSHTYSNSTTSAAIRAIYTINKQQRPVCVGLDRKVRIPSALSGTAKVYSEIQGLDALSGIRAIDNVNNFYYFWGFDIYHKFYLYKISSLTGAPIKKFEIPVERVLVAMNVRSDGKLIGLNWNEKSNREEFIEINPDSGKMKFLNTIPGLNWLYGGLSAIENSSKSKVSVLYQVGIDSNQITRLYVIDSESGKLLYSPAIPQYIADLRFNSKNELIGSRFVPGTQAGQLIRIRIVNGIVKIDNLGENPQIAYFTGGGDAIDNELNVFYQFSPRVSKDTDYEPKILSRNIKDDIIKTDKGIIDYIYELDALTGELLYERVLNVGAGFNDPEVNSKGEVVGIQQTPSKTWTFGRLKWALEP